MSERVQNTGPWDVWVNPLLFDTAPREKRKSEIKRKGIHSRHKARRGRKKKDTISVGWPGKRGFYDEASKG